MIDIDHFKQFNHTYGHPKGDHCLSLVANTLLSHVGDIGFVCRIGGEEFCIVLPNTNNEQAISLANKLRYEVEELKVPHASSHTSPYITKYWCRHNSSRFFPSNGFERIVSIG